MQASQDNTTATCYKSKLRPLLLNHDAKMVLKCEAGLEGWKASYGEFHGARYQHRADTRLFRSKHTSFRSKVEVHVLFASEGHTEAKYFTDANIDTVFQLTWYDPLIETHVLAGVAGAQVDLADFGKVS